VQKSESRGRRSGFRRVGSGIIGPISPIGPIAHSDL